MDYLNRRFGHRYTVYGVLCEQALYLAEGKFKGDWFGPGGYFRVVGSNLNVTDPTAAPNRLARSLRMLGTDYVLFRSLDAEQRYRLISSDRFNLVFSGGGSWVFRLRL